MGREVPRGKDEARRQDHRGAGDGAGIHDVWPEVLRMTFDLEKARAMICHYRIENPGDADTDCGLEDLIRQANLAEEALDEIERLQLELTQALKDLSSKDEIIEKLKKEFLKSTYERNKIRHGHAWYPGDEDYNEYLQRIDADAHKKSQESLDDVLRGN